MQYKEGGQVRAQYEAIIGLHSPRPAIASALRLAQQLRFFAAHLMTSAHPHRMDRGEFGPEQVDAYCDRMREVNEPLEQRAVEMFGVCAGKARELDVDDAAAEACRRALEELDPEDFPAFGERVAKPGPLPL